MLSEKCWKPEAVLRLILGVLICVFVGALLASLARQRYGTQFEDSPWHTIAATLNFQGIALILVHRFVREHQMEWSEAFGFRNHWQRALLFGGLATVLYLPVGRLLLWGSVELMSRFSMNPGEQQAVQALKHVQTTLQWMILGGMTIVIVPIAEELLFRGVLYPTIRQFGFPRLALWGTSLLFAAIHANLSIFLPMLLLALVLTLLYEKTGNLLASITAHSLFNAINFVLLFLTNDAGNSPPQ